MEMMQSSQRQQKDSSGMTLLEMVIAIAMLILFMGVVASVLSFTQQFFKQSETLDGSDVLLANNDSNGLLVDQHQLQLAMDQLIAQLQQPGLSKNAIEAIAAGPTKCSEDPANDWGLMGSSPPLPQESSKRYRICLETTPLREPTLNELLANEPPGIYILQALPDQLDASTLPSRQLFCRPRPFC